MKTTIIRYALTLTFCTFTLGGWAQEEYIINEDFSELPENIVLSEFHDWTFYGCKTGFNQSWANYALRVENYSINDKKYIGYAKTPYLNYSGDAILVFSYARGNKNETTIDVSIEHNGISQKLESIIVKSGDQGSTFNIASIKLINITPETKIRFSEGALNNTFAIDNVKVTKLPEIPLQDNIDNTSSLISYYTKTVTVNTRRTLLGGIWNTLCLPFDVSMADLELALGENQDIQVRTFHSYDSETKVMTFVDPFGGDNLLSAISAGTPFLIKLNSDVENPTFHAVTISDTDAQIIGKEGPVQFVGTYSPVELATDGTNIFITKDNTLALPAAGKNTMNGLRAYIVVPKNFNSSGARLLMDDGETASVSDLAPSVETGSKATYSLNGQRVENVRRGLYVVNGKLTLVK